MRECVRVCRCGCGCATGPAEAETEDVLEVLHEALELLSAEAGELALELDAVQLRLGREALRRRGALQLPARREVRRLHRQQVCAHAKRTEALLLPLRGYSKQAIELVMKRCSNFILSIPIC